MRDRSGGDGSAIPTLSARIDWGSAEFRRAGWRYLPARRDRRRAPRLTSRDSSRVPPLVVPVSASRRANGACDRLRRASANHPKLSQDSLRVKAKGQPAFQRPPQSAALDEKGVPPEYTERVLGAT